jgi:flagellar biosynthetic protein FlhB
MAEESNDGQEKTEDPSARRLDKAAEEGQVLKSQDMNVFTGLFGALLLMLGVPMIYQPVLAKWSGLIQFNKGHDLDAMIIERLLGVGEIIILVVIIIGVPMMILAILTQFAVGGGLNFAPKAMNFKASKLNLFKGLKRMFSMKALVELVKSMLKVTLLFGTAGYVVHSYIDDALQLPFRSLAQAIQSAGMIFPSLLAALLVVLALIALLDYTWQKYTHTKSLKMTKQELKDEFKQTEGSPEVKAKIRRMQMETAAKAARQQAALDDVASATAIITNPTHFAVALKYDVGSTDAPKILAMGRGRMAEMIISRANDARVTIFRNPLLARALYFSGEIGAEIPEKLYQAVAVVLAYIFRIDRGEDVLPPAVELPQDLMFDENGQQIAGGKDAQTT